MGSAFLISCQPLNHFHPDWYAVLVPLLHPAGNNSAASFQTSAVAGDLQCGKYYPVEAYQWMHLTLRDLSVYPSDLVEAGKFL